ncbi:hypothetical protein PQR01_21355, partial [Paraburkholderia rhynchosiae]
RSNRQLDDPGASTYKLDLIVRTNGATSMEPRSSMMNARVLVVSDTTANSHVEQTSKRFHLARTVIDPRNFAFVERDCEVHLAPTLATTRKVCGTESKMKYSGNASCTDMVRFRCGDGSDCKKESN